MKPSEDTVLLALMLLRIHEDKARIREGNAEWEHRAFPDEHTKKKVITRQSGHTLPRKPWLNSPRWQRRWGMISLMMIECVIVAGLAALVWFLCSAINNI